MPIYNLFICVMSAGMVAAISKISAIYYENKDYKNLYKTIKTTLGFNLIWSVAVAFSVFFLNDFLAVSIVKDLRASAALKIICPAMIFITLSNIFKGYFYGISRVMIPAVIDIFEKGIRISIILLLLTIFKSDSMNTRLAVSYSALCVGEFISLFLLYIYYRENRKKNIQNHHLPVEGRAQLLYNVLAVSVPLCINGVITNILSTASALIVPRRLAAAGIEYSTALSLIGKFSGMAMTIVFFPMVIIGSINTILIPDLSKSISKKDYHSSEKRIKDVLKLSFLLGICTIMICITIPDSLGLMIFKRRDLGQYIRFAAYSSPLYYASVTTYGILNGMGKHHILLRNSMVISVIEIIILFYLTSIPTINIYGYGITLIITSFLSVAANILEIKKSFQLTISSGNVLIYSLFTFLLYYILNIVYKILPDYLFLLKTYSVILISFSLFIFAIYYTKKISQ